MVILNGHEAGNSGNGQGDTYRRGSTSPTRRQKKKPTALGSCGLHCFRISNTSDTILYGVTPTSLSSRLKRHVENSAIGTETRHHPFPIASPKAGTVP
jgi:hypothetical protein